MRIEYHPAVRQDYREIPEGIRVTLVRHHRQHPDTGMDRE
jgi:hypothetical protein